MSISYTTPIPTPSEKVCYVLNRLAEKVQNPLYTRKSFLKKFLKGNQAMQPFVMDRIITMFLRETNEGIKFKIKSRRSYRFIFNDRQFTRSWKDLQDDYKQGKFHRHEVQLYAEHIDEFLADLALWFKQIGIPLVED